MNITFNGFYCILVKGKYTNGRIALILIDEEDGLEVATCTINIHDYPLKDNYVIIKDYSENEGILETLIHANIISLPQAYVKQGFINAPVCKLLIDTDTLKEI